MNGPMLDTSCPRCGGGFECGVNAGHCACFGLRLTEALRTELTARYPGRCLCLSCLRELIAGTGAAQGMMDACPSSTASPRRCSSSSGPPATSSPSSPPPTPTR